LPDRHISKELVNLINLQNAKTISYLMLQLETLIKAIGETAGIDYVEHLIDYELKKDTQNVRYSDSGKVKTITEKDVTDI